MKTLKHISAFFLLPLLIAGCSSGGTGASLHGPVTLDGAPIETGTLQFVPAEGTGQPVGTEIKQGRYEVKDVPLGNVTVMITALKDTGETVEEGGRKWPKLQSIVPLKYAQGFSIRVAAGSQEQPIALTTSP